MASPKVLAAIALTLIIAMPICLGYALSSETVQETKWETTDTVNLSDKILNHQTPFYSDYADAMNNSTLLAGGNFVSPDYVSTSSTYTSLPVFTNGSGTLTLTNPSTVTGGSASWNGSQYTQFMVGGSGAGSLIDGDIVSLSFNPDTLTKMDGYNSSTDRLNIPLISGSQTVNFYKNSNGTYTTTYNNQTYTYNYFLFYPTVGSQTNICTIACTMNYLEQVSISYTNWSINFGSTPVLLKMDTQSESIWVHTDTAQAFSKLNDTVIFNGATYSGITSISFASLNNPNTFTYVYRTESGAYANPAYGWSLPTANAYDWTNTFTNDYVRLMVNFTAPDYISLTPISNNGTSGSTLGMALNNDGTFFVGTELLGHYDCIMIEISTEYTKISGLSGWPTFGAPAQIYNSITLSPLITTNIELVRIYSQDASAAQFRVDSASILAGTFPSTYNYNLNLADLFPNKSFSLKLNSIGVYGDLLATAGTSYYVDNGRILVDGTSMQIKGLTISYRYNDSAAAYDIYFNSKYVATNPVPALWFGGEWSLTLTANILEKVTVSSQEWSPGNFAFDTQESFSGVLIFAAAAVFIGVGLYGARSGNKIGLLLIVCGGVLLIAINLI